MHGDKPARARSTRGTPKRSISTRRCCGSSTNPPRPTRNRRPSTRSPRRNLPAIARSAARDPAWSNAVFAQKRSVPACHDTTVGNEHLRHDRRAHHHQRERLLHTRLRCVAGAGSHGGHAGGRAVLRRHGRDSGGRKQDHRRVATAAEAGIVTTRALRPDSCWAPPPVLRASTRPEMARLPGHHRHEE